MDGTKEDYIENLKKEMAQELQSIKSDCASTLLGKEKSNQVKI